MKTHTPSLPRIYDVAYRLMAEDQVSLTSIAAAAEKQIESDDLGSGDALATVALKMRMAITLKPYVQRATYLVAAMDMIAEQTAEEIQDGATFKADTLDDVILLLTMSGDHYKELAAEIVTNHKTLMRGAAVLDTVYAYLDWLRSLAEGNQYPSAWPHNEAERKAAYKTLIDTLEFHTSPGARLSR